MAPAVAVAAAVEESKVEEDRGEARVEVANTRLAARAAAAVEG
jgi:hypothetical protein